MFKWIYDNPLPAATIALSIASNLASIIASGLRSRYQSNPPGWVLFWEGALDRVALNFGKRGGV